MAFYKFIRVRYRVSAFIAFAFSLSACLAAETNSSPIPQRFVQEVAHRFFQTNGLPGDAIQCVELDPEGKPRAFTSGRWVTLKAGSWQESPALRAASAGEFVFPDATGQPVRIPLPWDRVRQVVRHADRVWVVSESELVVWSGGRSQPYEPRLPGRIAQIAASGEGVLHAATSEGLFREMHGSWERIPVLDSVGRAWASQGVLGLAFDSAQQLWVATKAGVARQSAIGWSFYEGKDGLPYNDFTGIAAGPEGVVWFGTHLGAIRFQNGDWAYRQGFRWLPHDDVRQIVVDDSGNAWFGTAGGIGEIERRSMTLHEKAAIYEEEISRYIKRTPYGFTAEAPLRRVADKSSAAPDDSDNDGLWTSMYGAGECFAYAATHDPQSKVCAKQAFEALRFLQKVTQGGPHSPPKGFIARSIRSVELPDPNIGELESDRRTQKHDVLWKAYEPRWPKSADGKWYWKSDTSSDELDGHYFFYPLYFEFCADTEEEKERVREVVRDITDHLISHDYTLVDHDGTPTRWGVYGPQFVNRNPLWWPERGLNSLSMLSYLAVAEFVTGDAKYGKASRELIEKHGYAHNSMFAKLQHGPGSGNHSDDEMAFMDYYSLLRYSKDAELKGMIAFSFLNYWLDELPEMNPFFNFAYAAVSMGKSASNPFGTFDVSPWPGWREDSQKSLQGFSLDRLNWGHKNSHRIDLARLWDHQGRDVYEREKHPRGYLVKGKVVPVENRHFEHWNTDPWQLDYPGSGNVLGSGTVFLLPYYMGLYHGYIERP